MKHIQKSLNKTNLFKLYLIWILKKKNQEVYHTPYIFGIIDESQLNSNQVFVLNFISIIRLRYSNMLFDIRISYLLHNKLPQNSVAKNNI